MQAIPLPRSLPDRRTTGTVVPSGSAEQGALNFQPALVIR